MIRLALVIVAALALAACAPTDPGTLPTLAPTVPPADVVPTQETLDNGGGEEAPSDDLNLGEGGAGLFSATLTGALDQILAGSGTFSCEGNVHVLGVSSGADVLTFTMPPGLAAGEYTVEGDASTVSSYLEVGGTPYDGDVFGIVTLEAIPAAAGDPVSGSFDMNYIVEGDTVNAVGSFDLLAGSVCE